MNKRFLLGLVAGAVVSLGANAAVSDGVVRVGVLNDQSGPYSASGGPGSVAAAEMAAEDYIKATGSKLKVEVVAGDMQNKPDVGAAIARKWFDANGVDVIVDVPNSAVALAVNEITRQKNKVVLFSGAGTADLTGSACSPNTVHWSYDTWMLSHGAANALMARGDDSWFFISADYAFGKILAQETGDTVRAQGGKVLETVHVPLGTTDFSSFLLHAQASKAKVVGLANAGADTSNSAKQAREFGLIAGGQTIAALSMTLDSVDGLGLEAGQGLVFMVSYYWDANDSSRAWAQRFAERYDGPPTNHMAGTYSSVLHYLSAVDALQDDTDGVKIVEQMKSMPVDDPLFGKGEIRADGRFVHQAYLVQVKKPSESHAKYDYLDILETIPGDKAFRPLEEGGCDLVNAAAGEKS